MAINTRPIVPLTALLLLLGASSPASAAPAPAKVKAKAKAPSKAEALILAIMARNEPKAIALINAGVSPHAAPGLKDPLFTAAAFNEPKVAELLIQKGARANFRSGGLYGDEAPLHVAGRNGCASVVPVLIKGGADVNILNQHHQSPLWLAMSMVRKETVAALLSGGAKPDLADEEGVTPLMLAAQGFPAILVKADAIEHGMKEEDADKLKDEEFRKRGLSISQEMVDMLLKKGADPNRQDKLGRTALTYAGAQIDIPGNQALLDRLAAAGAKEPKPSLAAAMAAEDLGRFRAALDAGADLNGRNEDGTPYLITLCATEGRQEWVRLLLEKGADPNAKNKDGNAALHVVAFAGNLPLLRLLVEHKADVNLPGQNGITPVMGCGAEAATFLLEHGADPNAREKTQRTALFYAPTADVWKVLLEHGADPNVVEPSAGGTPFLNLLEFSKFADAASLKLAIEKGADVNKAYTDGVTPLMMACTRLKGELAQILLEHGANPNARAKDGSTALMYAAGHDNLPALKLLLEKHVDPNAATPSGITALKNAAAQKGPSRAVLIQALKAAGATR